MSTHSNLDREAFQQLLADSFAVQESQINSRSLSAVMEVQRLVARGDLDVDGAMQRIVESARDVAGATGVAIGLLEGGKLGYKAGSGSTESYIGCQVTASLTVSGTLSGREILRVEDAQTDPRIEAAICRQFGAQSLLMLPIYRGRALAGVLEVLFSDPHSFNDWEVRTYRLMTRQIEAAMCQTAPLEPTRNLTCELPAKTQPREHIASLAQVPSNRASFLHLVSATHSVNHPHGTSATATRSPALKRPRGLATSSIHPGNDIRWPWLRRSLALAAVASALGVAGWLAYSSLLPGSSRGSSALPTSAANEPQARSQAEAGPPGKTTPAVQTAPAPMKEVRPGLRRVRVSKNEVDYIGEDVTVRLFTYAPAQRRTPTHESGVKYVGDDVTVRYFTPSPAARSASR